MCQATWEDLGMSCQMYLALKMSDSSGDLVVSIVAAFFIVGGNGSGESRASDEPSCPGKRHQRIRTCLSGEVESFSSLTRWQAPAAKYPKNVERRPDRIPDVRYPGGMSTEKNSGCEMSGWNERCHVSQEAVCVSKGEGATRQFLGRIPQEMYGCLLEQLPSLASATTLRPQFEH